MTPHLDDELLTRMLNLQPCEGEHEDVCGDCGAVL